MDKVFSYYSVDKKASYLTGIPASTTITRLFSVNSAFAQALGFAYLHQIGNKIDKYCRACWQKEWEYAIMYGKAKEWEDET